MLEAVKSNNSWIRGRCSVPEGTTCAARSSCSASTTLHCFAKIPGGGSAHSTRTSIGVQRSLQQKSYLLEPACSSSLVENSFANRVITTTIQHPCTRNLIKSIQLNLNKRFFVPLFQTASVLGARVQEDSACTPARTVKPECARSASRCAELRN